MCAPVSFGLMNFIILKVTVHVIFDRSCQLRPLVLFSLPVGIIALRRQYMFLFFMLDKIVLDICFFLFYMIFPFNLVIFPCQFHPGEVGFLGLGVLGHSS